MDINVRLVIASINWLTGDFYTIGKEGDNKWSAIDTDNFPSEQPIDSARRLFEDLANIEPNWPEYSLFSVNKLAPEHMLVTFTTNIPFSTKLKDGFKWYSTASVPIGVPGQDALTSAMRGIK